MTRRDAHTPSRRSPAASTLSRTVARVAAPPPVITPLCVDVRDLLRRAAAPSSDAPSGAQSIASDREPETVVLPSVSQQSSPQQAQATPPLHNKGSVSWPPLYQPFGGFAVRSEPPPLSPTDPVIVDSILGQPSVHTITLPGFSRKCGPGTLSAARMPSAQRSSLESSVVAPPLMATFVQRFSASSSRPPLSDSTASSSSVFADKMARRSISGTAAPSVAFSGNPTAPPTPLADAVDNSWGVKRANAAGDVGPSKLSLAAQQTMTNVLGQLHSYTSGLTAAKVISTAQKFTDAYPGDVAVSPSFFNGSVRHDGARAPLAAFQPSSRDATTANSTLTHLWRRCPALASATFSRVDMHPQRPHGAVEASVAQCRGLAYHKPHAAAFRNTVQVRRASESPPRTIPPAFRRHLQFAEAVPTTRRPKRK
ncbi:hypothetical protein JKF63_00182 [Porcisia hertigi]|uniref:Uncharacterized protein n=1 Tax=Porcisia hertigi TaxID=2761500 RepID=A0A836I940_9TRYP|nr:hypothetical protein JKF63_00182 [Porcisia hertigi]